MTEIEKWKEKYEADNKEWLRIEEMLNTEVASKDIEIARLQAENEVTVSVCNENVELKKILIELGVAASVYLSLDGSEKIYDAVKLQGARIKLRADIQRAKDLTK